MKMMIRMMFTSREQSTQLGSRSRRRKTLKKKTTYLSLRYFVFIKKRVMMFSIIDDIVVFVNPLTITDHSNDQISIAMKRFAVT